MEKQSQELEIRSQLASYLAGDMTLSAFSDWFVEKTWGEETSESFSDLVSEIELVLAEFTSGHRSEEEVKNLLRPHVTDYTIYLRLGDKEEKL
jgi:hypothetical protein